MNIQIHDIATIEKQVTKYNKSVADNTPQFFCTKLVLKDKKGKRQAEITIFNTGDNMTVFAESPMEEKG